jgi:hypothetical protein
MSISALRDAFNGITLPVGMRCTGCRMRYVDADGVSNVHRNFQILEFDVVRSGDNLQKTLFSKPIPGGAVLVAEAMAFAQAIVAGSFEP